MAGCFGFLPRISPSRQEPDFALPAGKTRHLARPGLSLTSAGLFSAALHANQRKSEKFYDAICASAFYRNPAAVVFVHRPHWADSAGGPSWCPLKTTPTGRPCCAALLREGRKDRKRTVRRGFSVKKTLCKIKIQTPGSRADPNSRVRRRWK